MQGLLALALFALSTQCILADVSIISRAEWKAKPSLQEFTPLELPVERVIVAHTAGRECITKDACMQEIRNIQNFHLKINFDDISYNYLIGNDGNIYEGRGGTGQGALAKGFNAGSIGVGFIGTFQKDKPTPAAVEAFKSLLEKLKGEGKLKAQYKLFGHRQLSPSISPGDALYAEVQKWPNWSAEI